MPNNFPLIALLTITILQPVNAAETLCRSTEHTFFSCPADPSGKIISVCGGLNSQSGDYLQYRFGLLGKIELEYPKAQKGSANRFWWDGRSHSNVSDSWLWFKNDGYVYSIFYIKDRIKSRNVPMVRTGVVIENKSDKRPARSLHCAKRATGDFTQLAEIVQWAEVDD
jgi:hypothetical protein